MKQTFYFRDGSEYVINNAIIPMRAHFEKGHVTWVIVPGDKGELFIHLKYVVYIHEEE